MLLSTDTQKQFEQLLVDNNLLSKDEFEKLKLEALKENKSLLALISERRLLKEEDLVKVLAQANNVPYANIQGFQVDPKFLELIPKELAESYRVVPMGENLGRLVIGMVDPLNLQAIDFISRKIGRPITPYMVSEASINSVLKQYNVSKEVSEVIDTASQLSDQAATELKKGESTKKVETLVQDAPITRALKTILEYAVEQRASDIHIEPREDKLHVRLRVDGILRDIMQLPISVEPALVSRVKILSNLKIDEHRVPQDGEFRVNVADKDIDIRVAISPVVYGEQVVIRILDKDETILSFDRLGFRGRAARSISEGVKRPHGMILATGPTGSGKSTTLYTIIKLIQSDAINIVTLEDPVEYKIGGINQIQVNPDVGLTFANGLRSILRQDPDVVMVGEVRDHETADLAVQAALTGHIVLSTLHTNSAPGVLPRLLDMGIEPFLIASTVNTVIGQRLVRKVCEKCQKPYQSSEAETLAIKKVLSSVLPKTTGDVAKVKADLGYDTLPLADQNAYTLLKGEGCTDCNEGYKGRIGIYEVFTMSNGIEKLLTQQGTTSQLQKQAQAEGMLSMQQDGYLKALNGLTTLAEVARVTADY